MESSASPEGPAALGSAFDVESYATSDKLLRPGARVLSRYVIERQIGEGGMGMVFAARHLGLGQRVAIKVLTAQWSRHPVVAQRLREEARATNAIAHPNLVQVLDAGELPDGRPFLVMEFLDGVSLYERLREVGRLPSASVLEIAQQILRALHAAHRLGIVHRDLKPDNVMLVGDGARAMVKLLDFGISAHLTRGTEVERLTRPGQALGTPEYMAPEQGRGADPDPRFDVYALGVMLYEMLTGELPYAGGDFVALLMRKATTVAPIITRQDVPHRLADLVSSMLSSDPARRPKDAQACLEALSVLEVGTSRPAKRFGWKMVLILGLVAIVLWVVVLWIFGLGGFT